MDTGAKTLAQLSEENKNEKKYVTLDTGSKISGYTKDYLERLCRLNKVEYRIWSNGNFVIELESLLRETQALLLSYEGINFIDIKELTDPTPQVVGNILSSALKEITTTVAPVYKTPAPSVPTFSEKVNTPSAQVSFVGRAIVSDALHPEEKNSPKVEVKKAEPALAVTPLAPLAEPKKEETATHIPVTKFNMDSLRGKTVSAPESAKPASEHVPIIAVNSSHDDWDAQLLGAQPSEVSRHIPIVKESSPLGSTETQPQSTASSPVANTASVQSGYTPPSGQKVIVFSSNEGKEVLENSLIIPSPISPASIPVPPKKETSIVIPAPTLPVAPLVSLPMLTHSPELNTPESISPPAPQKSPLLPMKSEEHHLTPYEMHPLMKSSGFNLVFATMLIASSFTMLGGKVFENIGGKLNTASYVAGVGAIGGNLPVTLTPTSTNAAKETHSAVLPFSNDIVATSGKKENSIIVRPIFENGEQGKSYEYIVTSKDSASTTTSKY